MYHIAICDDVVDYIQYMKRLLFQSGFVEDEVTIYEYHSGEEMIQALENHERIHLLILDMQMKVLDGNETAKLFRKQFPSAVMVFCSGSCLPTVESFETTPFRYLLKEYTDEKMIQELQVVMCSVNPLLGFAFICAAGYWGSERGQDFSDWWFREVLGLYDDAGAYTYPVDPLILDLDGDGIETVSVEDGVNFDFDNNGFAEKTGWVGKDDGLLVRDINGNGQIDNGGELFGDLTVAEDFTAENGFEALKYFDTNEDNIINHLDEIYSELRV